MSQYRLGYWANPSNDCKTNLDKIVNWSCSFLSILDQDIGPILIEILSQSVQYYKPILFEIMNQAVPEPISSFWILFKIQESGC